MLHLDAVHSSARAADVFALKPPPPDATLLSSSHCLDKCCYGPLRQPVLCSKSMLSVLPSSNDLDRVNAVVSDQRDVCRPPKSKENSELRPLPRLRVAWNPSGPPRPPKPLVPSSRSTESGSVVVVHEPAEPGLSPENHRPCRENGGRSMNGPERPSMTGSSNNSGSGDGRSWLADVAASANISNSHGVAPPANPRLHESQSLLTSPAGSLFPPPVSLGGTEFTSTASPRIYSQYPLHTSYFSGHSQSASTPTHLSTLTPYSYYPFQFPPGYSSSHVLPRPVPQIEPYSTVLASMGSHPRSAFLPSQFSSLSPSTSSPGPVFQTGPRPLTPGFNQTVHLQPPQQYPSPSSVDLSPVEARSPKDSERSLQQQRHRVTSGSPQRCDNSNRMQNPGCSNAKSAAKNPSSPTSSSTSLLLSKSNINPVILSQEVCAKMDSNREQSYRVPSGKEGSMKHRILTRPPDIRIDPLSFEELSPSDTPMSARSEEHPSPKRSKSLAAATSASMPSTPLRPNAPAWRTPSPGGTFAPPASTVPSTQTTSSTGPPTATQLHYPVHFMKGSIIQLANGDLKNVEELRTEDFVSSAELSGDLKIDSSTVVRIQENIETGTCMLSFSVGEQRVQVTVEAALEHPFFVFGQGWSSCLPDRTFQRYSLQCQKLQVGDVCISLTHRDVPRNNNATASATTIAAATVSTSEATVTGGTMALVPPHPVTFGPSSTATFLVSSSSARGAAAPNSAPAAPQTHSIETQTPTSEASVVPMVVVTTNSATTAPLTSTSSAATTTTPSTATGAPAPAVASSTVTPRKRRWSAPDKISDEPGSSAKLS